MSFILSSASAVSIGGRAVSEIRVGGELVWTAEEKLWRGDLSAWDLRYTGDAICSEVGWGSISLDNTALLLGSGGNHGQSYGYGAFAYFSEKRRLEPGSLISWEGSARNAGANGRFAIAVYSAIPAYYTEAYDAHQVQRAEFTPSDSSASLTFTRSEGDYYVGLLAYSLPGSFASASQYLTTTRFTLK